MSQTNGKSQAVAKRTDRTPLSRRDPIAIAKHFAASGFFKDSTDMSKAVVKIVAGEELGLGPMTAMNGIHIIEGKPSLSAGLLAGLVKRDPDYDFEIVVLNDDGCRLRFSRYGETLGEVEFGANDAKRVRAKENGQWKPLAETQRYRNYPADLFFARAMSRGVRRYAPDITMGAAHVPEELQDGGGSDFLDGEVEEVDGEIVGNGQPEEAASDTEVTDAEEVEEPEPETISKAEAERIYETACAIDSIEPDQFARAAAFVLDKPVEVSPKKSAIATLATATEEQAGEIKAWIERQIPAEPTEESTQGEGDESDE